MLVFFANLGNFSSDIWPYFFFSQNGWLRAVLDGKSSQEHPVNVIVSPLLVLHLFLMTPDDIICDIAVYADDTTLHSKCDQLSDLWQ